MIMPLMYCVPVSGGLPDNSLPGGGGGGGGNRPDNTLPNLPDYPDNGLPNGGGGVIEPIPGHPIVLPDSPVAGNLPAVIWPGIPAHPIVIPPGGPATLPMPPGAIWPPLPPAAGTNKLLVIVLIPGVGARWTMIDPTLRPTPR
jgi:hypothetical protein